MRWHELTVNTTEEAAELIAHFFHELGAGGVSVEESGTLNKQRDTSLGQWYERPLNDIPEGKAVLKGYFPESEDIDAIVAALETEIGKLPQFGIDAGRPTIERAVVDEEDWANAWKQYYKPLRITERLTIKPTWEPYEASPNEQVIELDPGMAFGTGTHATTALCLKMLEQVVQPGDDVIDVGTGSGVLAIAAVKLGARRVLAIDLDPVAVSSAEQNARLNGLEANISVKKSDLLQILTEPAGSGEALGVKLPVRVVVANLLAEIILRCVDDVYRVLQPGGTFIASGIIEAKRAQVEQALTAAGFVVEKRLFEDDWTALAAVKRQV